MAKTILLFTVARRQRNATQVPLSWVQRKLHDADLLAAPAVDATDRSHGKEQHGEKRAPSETDEPRSAAGRADVTDHRHADSAIRK